MRGKVFARLIASATGGITPAYAGKRYLCNSCLEGHGDHPRVCGEKRPVPAGLMLLAGSPPRMRGKVTCTGSHADALGITPAYAGKSSKRGSNSQWLRDHPRVCGEKCHVPALRRCEPGSPPRMRGKGAQYSLPVWRHRITPAYAGKSLPSRACPPSCWDHPRVCGEKHIRVVCGCTRVGSPPRMRGKEAAGKLCSPGRGITPAYAGKSGDLGQSAAQTGDHPRVCGEKHRPSKTQSRPAGSPPRMRGKGKRSDGAGKRRRITPAYAGKRQ